MWAKMMHRNRLIFLCHISIRLSCISIRFNLVSWTWFAQTCFLLAVKLSHYVARRQKDCVIYTRDYSNLRWSLNLNVRENWLSESQEQRIAHTEAKRSQQQHFFGFFNFQECLLRFSGFSSTFGGNLTFLVY